ncbi:ribosome maturation factor [Sulfurospirillum multivorans]|uniref:Ribosome maturation factor RimP n=2 Tax=Sulfurospirillum multivorans TaxID=66821 RepID=A0AA86AJC7_SULMK|nr:ribosome maturation factor [Sulfurospirillum multivorans]AHJ11611.1 ribosome maturation factor RimP [Sulfurospirillum multivorans DSM 12446]QEH05111.1 ribosome maturation factor RimP [Sulfurospirillum multivorans]
MLDQEKIVKIVESCGVSFYDTEVANEFDKRIFRLYITSKEGISLDKCAEISRILSPIFDLEPPLEGEYLFEVSSPGIERKLTKPEHFTASIGEKVKVKLNSKEKFIGLLESFADNVACVRVENELKQISLNEIESIRTYFEW